MDRVRRIGLAEKPAARSMDVRRLMSPRLEPSRETAENQAASELRVQMNTISHSHSHPVKLVQDTVDVREFDGRSGYRRPMIR